MSDSVTNASISQILNKCVSTSFESATVEKACGSLELLAANANSSTSELAKALINFLFQIHSGAIKPNQSTIVLINESIALFENVDATKNQPTESAGELNSLLERIDLEASGGFDPDEADGEDIQNARELTLNEKQRLRNQLGRLHTGLEAFRQGVVSDSVDASRLANLTNRYQDLIHSMRAGLAHANLVTATELEQRIAIETNMSSDRMSVDATVAMSSSITSHFVGIIRSLSLLEIGELNKLEISNTDANSLNAIVTFELAESLANALQAIASKLEIHPSLSLLDESELMQFAIVSSNPNETESVRSFAPSALLCHRLNGTLSTSVSDQFLELRVSLPRDISLERVTTFKFGEDLYAIRDHDVVNIEFNPAVNSKSFDPVIEFHGNELPIRNSRSKIDKFGKSPCLILRGDRCQYGLFVNALEPAGQVLDSDTEEKRGCCTLFDGRSAILLDASDLESELKPNRVAKSVLADYVLCLDGSVPSSWMQGLASKVDYAAGARHAKQTIQEHRPVAVVASIETIRSQLDLIRFIATKKITLIANGQSLNPASVDQEVHFNHAFTSRTELRAIAQSLRATPNS